MFFLRFVLFMMFIRFFCVFLLIFLGFVCSSPGLSFDFPKIFQCVRVMCSVFVLGFSICSLIFVADLFNMIFVCFFLGLFYLWWSYGFSACFFDLPRVFLLFSWPFLRFSRVFPMFSCDVFCLFLGFSCVFRHIFGRFV